MEILNLFLVAPKGYEDRASVIVAPDKKTAIDKANTHPAIKELTDAGADLVALDVSHGLYIQGYDIQVSRRGMFH